MGSAALVLLSDEGAKLVVSYLGNAARAEQYSSKAAVCQADLAKPADRATLLDAAPDLYGLVVFSGVPARVKNPAEQQEAMLLSHEVNYLGPILLAREVAERMKA